MRYLVRLENSKKARPSDGQRLARVAYEAIRTYRSDVGNLRVSSSAIELDLLLDLDEALQDSLKALQNQLGPLLTLRKLDVPAAPGKEADVIRLGLELFNEERYWESHEALESAWLTATGKEKEILQGLILLAAALVHWQKNQLDVTVSVMRRARDKLSGHNGEQFGIDLNDLKVRVDRILRSGQPEFFKIEARAQSPKSGQTNSDRSNS